MDELLPYQPHISLKKRRERRGEEREEGRGGEGREGEERGGKGNGGEGRREEGRGGEGRKEAGCIMLLNSLCLPPKPFSSSSSPLMTNGVMSSFEPMADTC